MIWRVILGSRDTVSRDQSRLRGANYDFTIGADKRHTGIGRTNHVTDCDTRRALPGRANGGVMPTWP